MPHPWLKQERSGLELGEAIHRSINLARHRQRIGHALMGEGSQVSARNPRRKRLEVNAITRNSNICLLASKFRQPVKIHNDSATRLINVDVGGGYVGMREFNAESNASAEVSTPTSSHKALTRSTCSFVAGGGATRNPDSSSCSVPPSYRLQGAVN